MTNEKMSRFVQNLKIISIKKLRVNISKFELGGKCKVIINIKKLFRQFDI